MRIFAYNQLMNYAQATIKSDILKALAHPIRVILVDALSRGDYAVGELNELVAVDQSTISRHLSQLKKAGIVSEHKQGTRVIHHLETPCILQAIECAEAVLMDAHARRSGLLGRSMGEAIVPEISELTDIKYHSINKSKENTMKKIQVLGTGCSKCKQLTANAEAAVKALGMDTAVEKVTDIKEIMSFGVMSTPAIVVDGKVQSTGKVLSAEEIKKLIG